MYLLQRAIILPREKIRESFLKLNIRSALAENREANKAEENKEEEIGNSRVR